MKLKAGHLAYITSQERAFQACNPHPTIGAGLPEGVDSHCDQWEGGEDVYYALHRRIVIVSVSLRPKLIPYPPDCIKKGDGCLIPQYAFVVRNELSPAVCCPVSAAKVEASKTVCLAWACLVVWRKPNLVRQG